MSESYRPRKGRPPGSKNKPKEEIEVEVELEKPEAQAARAGYEVVQECPCCHITVTEYGWAVPLYFCARCQSKMVARQPKLVG